jgi:hypothetical protein
MLVAPAIYSIGTCCGRFPRSCWAFRLGSLHRRQQTTCFRVSHSHGRLSIWEDGIDTQDITLSIPEDVLIKVKVIAGRRQTSVSRMVTEMLERLIEQDDHYTRARTRHLRLLQDGQDLGTGGKIAVKRDDLRRRPA